jgi:GcrA cell cycle regulator
MEWSEAVITDLRNLWSEGLSTAEIGRRLGISKNAVVGKAHRLALDPRPSPIRRSAAPAVVQPPRAVGSTLPVLPTRQLRPARPAAVSPAPRPATTPSPRLAVAVNPTFTRTVACCWPIGEPGTTSFRFCSDSAIHGKPYCQQHAQLAYVKVRDRREDAA